MRIQFIFALMFLCAAQGVSQESDASARADYARPETVTAGLTVLRGSVSTQFGAFHFVALKIKKDTHSLNVASAATGYGSGSYGNGGYGSARVQTLFGFKEDARAHAVLSGGFMTTIYPPVPLGLITHNGKEVNRSASTELLDGIVTSEGNRLEIRRFTDSTDCLADCLQAGPLLVGDKRVTLRDNYTDSGIEGSYRRAFVATLPDGYFMLGIASGAKLRALATFLAAPVDRGGLGCLDALNLSGSTSAGMLWDGGSDGDTKFPIASALVVR